MRRAAAPLVLLSLAGIALGVWRQDRQAALNRRLVQAVRHRQAADAERLLTAGADANTASISGAPPALWRRIIELFDSRARQRPRLAVPVLLTAVAHHDPEIVRSLLAHGADVNRNGNGNQPNALAWAALHGEADLVALSLPGANRDTKSAALASACSSCQLDIVRLLLAQGADVNGRDRVGMTPLLWAVTGAPDARHRQLTRILLGAGADPRATYREPDTGRLWTARALAHSPHGDPATARLIDDALKTP